MKRLPPLNWLRSFEAAARHLSFTQAAEELCLTQAAVSKQVKNLEFHLGSELFVRLPHGLKLSDSGVAYLPSVSDAIQRLSASTKELFSESKDNQINLRVSLVFFQNCLADLLPSFYSSHPDLKLNVSSFVWVDQAETESGVNLEIRYGNGNWPNLHSLCLQKDYLFPVCHPRESLSKLSELDQVYLLHCLGYTEGWEHWLQFAEVEYIEPRGHRYFDTLLATLKMAELGQGLALARSSLVKTHLSTGALIAPFDRKLPSEEAFHLVFSKAKLDQASVTFIRWLAHQFGLEAPC